MRGRDGELPVIIIMDNSLFRQGLSMLLESDGDISVVAQVETPGAVAETLGRMPECVVVLDVDARSGGRGVADTVACRAATPGCRIVIISEVGGTELRVLEDRPVVEGQEHVEEGQRVLRKDERPDAAPQAIARDQDPTEDTADDRRDDAEGVVGEAVLRQRDADVLEERVGHVLEQRLADAEGGDEGDALQFVGRVAQGILDDAAFPVLDGEQERFVLAGAALVRGGESGRQHGQVLRGTAKPAVEFVVDVHELGGQALGDRVVRFADHQLERLHGTVGSGFLTVGGRFTNDLSIASANVGAPLRRAAAPAAESDHPVEFRPVPPGVVGGVHDDESAAVLHVVLEVPACLLRPIRRAETEVADHDVILAEIG